MSTILHIVPRMPPMIDGIGDFAACLGTHLHRHFGFSNVYLSCDPAQIRTAQITAVPRQSAAALTSTLANLRFDHILLHYSGYGFQKRGVPRWLVSGLEFADRQKPLHVFFHEAWAAGTWRESAFYLQPAQRALAGKLCATASTVFTSNPKMAALLEPFTREITIVPIPSNIPGIETVPQRTISGPLRLMVFGQQHTRIRSLDAHRDWLKQVARHHPIHWTVAGSGVPEEMRAEHELLRGAAEVIVLANAEPEAIRDAFLRSDFSLSFYPADLVTKSGSVMASVACGCPVIFAQNGSQAPFPVFDASHSPDLLRARDSGEAWSVASSALEWYRANAAWPAAAKTIGETLETETFVSA